MRPIYVCVCVYPYVPYANSLQYVQLCNPMDYSPPGSSAHGILQVRILEWVAMPSSKGSSQPRDIYVCVCICVYIYVYRYIYTYRYRFLLIQRKESS